MNRRELFSGSLGECANPQFANAKRIPNVVLRNQDNVPLRFYDDLVKGKQIVVNMMYTHCEGFCSAITQRMVQVHQALAPRMGKNLFMCSISLKPEEDDPAALKAFALEQRANLPGWQFLTGSPYDIETLRFSLLRHNHIKFDLDLETHAARLRIINDVTGRWVHVAAMANPATVVQHISWADPPLTEAQRREENRKLQKQIDAEVARHGYRKVV